MATWHDVRAMRASPPGYASSGQRRKTFGSALQQAEELATAAEHAGYSTKPILLFYALAQAYRAICAAHLKGDWQPTGHGVAVPNRGSAVLDVAVKNDGAGLYQAAMSVAKEAPLAGEVTLGALWASNPELRHQAPAEVLSLPGALTLHRQYPPPTDPSAPDDALFMTVDGLTEVADAAAFSAALADYPSLSQAQPATYPTGLQIGALSAEVDRNGVAHRSWPGVVALLPVLRIPLANPEDYEGRFEELAPVGVERTERRMAPPAIGDPPQVLGPVGTSWLLLIGLASLARYHPALWTSALDLDRSPLAVGLQRALDRFQESLPHYVLDR